MSDARRFIPWVTYALAAVNVIVFGVTLALGAPLMGADPPQMLDWGGNFGPLTLDGEQWRLFTSMFLHYGVLHLGMNLLGLVDGGRHVERMYGHVGFASLYLVAGLAGSLVSAMRGVGVSVGASGAIYGVFGAFGAFLLLHRDRIDKVELGKQVRGLLAFLAINIYLTFSIQGLDMGAHLGGLAGGFVAGLALEWRRGATDKQRLVRAVLVGALGTGVVFGASFVVPSAPNPRAVLDDIGVAEAAHERLQGLPNAEAADLAEREVIPAWQKASKKLQAANLPGQGRALLLEYTQAQERWLTLFVEGIRKNDPTALERAIQERDKVNEIVDRITKHMQE